MINLYDIQAAFQSIKVSNGTYELAIDSSGYITSNINGTVTVSATNLDIRDLAYASDSVTAHQGGTWDIGTLTSITNAVAVTDNGGSLTVDASNLDIRDLTSASDSVEIKTAAGQALAIDASGYITANINGSVTVSATDLDIRNLDYSTDNVALKGSTGNQLVVNSDGSLNVNQTVAGYGAWKVSAQTITDTESEIAGTPLAGRLSILVQNLGNKEFYLRDVTGVSTSNGLKIPANGYFEADLDAVANLFAICPTGTTASVRVAEYAA